MEKRQLAMSIKDLKKRASFLALWGRISKMWSEQTARKICTDILEGSSFQYFAQLSDEQLRQNIELLSYSQGSNVHKEPNMSKMEEEIGNDQSSKISRNNIKNPERQIKEFKRAENPKHIENINNSKQEIKRSQKEEDYGPTYYAEKTLDFICSSYQGFCQFIQQRDLKNFISLWERHLSSEILSEYQLRSVANSNSLERYLLAVDSALFYSTGKNHRLRVTQALAIYCFLLKNNVKKILLQILTGEGKSTTIACLAAILAMQKKNVDIITTNQILARRDVEQKKKFYELLGLKVAHNFSDERLKPKKCYESYTIVYGTAHSFQVDLLYTEYKKKQTRKNRPYEIGIIDEVDEMFVDEKDHQTLLATTYTGLSELIMPMRIIWQHIVTEKYVIDNEGTIKMFLHGEKEEIIEGEARVIMEQIMRGIREKFKNQIIPVWRQEFVDLSLENWIWSALNAAYNYKEKTHYLIQGGKIIPIDYQSTGCLHAGVQWQNGLHQFLQMKHGLNTTTQGMVSNFISNLGHFCKYETLFGLTGTLGSKQSKHFLKETYSVQMLEIPSYQERRLQIIPGYLMYSEKQWADRILKEVASMMQSQRSLLIICESISVVDCIKQLISQFQFRDKHPRRITTLKTGEQNIDNKVDCSQIIIATNIAGRGTDLKITKRLQQKQGLHVIVTFIPENQRVQMQARGRAGRNGAPGSSIVIANYRRYCNQINQPQMNQQTFMFQNLENKLPFYLENVRDKIEEEKMKENKKIVDNLRMKDRIFFNYCEAVNKIPNFQSNRSIREAIQQKWAIYLKKAEILKLSNEETEAGANDLFTQFVKNPQSHYNPNHAVLRGVQKMFDKPKEAQKLFMQAEKSETNLTNKIAANIYHATTSINLDPKNKDNIKNGFKQLQKLGPLIEERKNIIKAVHSVSQSTNNDKIIDHLQRQQKDENQKLLNSLKGNKKDVPKMKEMNKNLHGRSQEMDKQENKADKLLNIAQVNVLDQVANHIQKQMNKYNDLKQGQWIEFTYQPLHSIIDKTPGKEEQIQEAINKVNSDGLIVVPKAEIKKKKTPWWKRALIFCLGVLQICIGALILSASGGSVAAFGAGMITKGVQDCFNALFRPQLCNDLKKYFSQKAISYAVDLALLGPKGIKELRELGSKSLQVFKNKSMSEVMNIAAKNIKQGLKKYPGNFDQVIKKKIYQGMGKKTIDQMKKQVNNKSFDQVIKNPELKKMVDKGIDKQNQVEKKLDGVKENFKINLEKSLQSIIGREVKKIENKLSVLEIKEQQIKILINNSFIQNFLPHFNPDNPKSRKDLYKRVVLFMSQNCQNKKPGELFLIKFGIDNFLATTISEIPKSQMNVLLEATWSSKINDTIVDNYNQKVNSTKVLAEEHANLVNRHDNTPLTVRQRNQLAEQIKYKANQHNLLIKNIQRDKKQVDTVLPIIDKNVEKMIRQKIIVGGEVDFKNDKIKDIPLPIINALRDIKKLKPKGEVKIGTVHNLIKQKAMNPILNICQKAIDEIIGITAETGADLSSIQNKLTKDLGYD